MPTTISGSNGVTTPTGAVYNSIQSMTAKTASGTAVDFTGIPSWVKRITVMFQGVSTNFVSGCSVAMPDVVYRLSINIVNAGGLFDAGSVNIMYE